MQQKAALEGRIRKLNEEAEIARWFECVCVWFVCRSCVVCVFCWWLMPTLAADAFVPGCRRRG